MFKELFSDAAVQNIHQKHIMETDVMPPFFSFFFFANSSGETRTLPRSSSMAAGLEKNGRSRVQAIFSHAAGDNGTLLSFSEGDVITLLVPEARDGWHYGENEKNKM